MITPDLAKRLQNAGLEWEPQLHDFFMVPGGSLEERLFVISDMQAYVELYRGTPMVTFHGALEWALDYVQQQEVVWMPTEEQLRDRLAGLVGEFVLVRDDAGYHCTLVSDGHDLTFSAASGSEAYAEALLYLLLARNMHAGAN